MSKVWKGQVRILTTPSGKSCAVINSGAKGKPLVFAGEWRRSEEESLRDAAGWLEDKGYVHSITHDLKGRDL